MNKILITLLLALLSSNVNAETKKSASQISAEKAVAAALAGVEAAKVSDNEPPRTSEMIAKDLTGQVIGIADGDTLTLLDDKKVQHKIRINAIDAPELGQPYGQASKQALSSLCFGKTAQITYVTTDRYGRTVGDVVCDKRDGNVAALLLDDGMAWIYEKYIQNEYLHLYVFQESAQDKRIGLWADRNPVPPWDWRKSKK